MFTSSLLLFLPALSLCSPTPTVLERASQPDDPVHSSDAPPPDWATRPIGGVPIPKPISQPGAEKRQCSHNLWSGTRSLLPPTDQGAKPGDTVPYFVPSKESCILIGHFRFESAGTNTVGKTPVIALPIQKNYYFSYYVPQTHSDITIKSIKLWTVAANAPKPEDREKYTFSQLITIPDRSSPNPDSGSKPGENGYFGFAIPEDGPTPPVNPIRNVQFEIEFTGPGPVGYVGLYSTVNGGDTPDLSPAFGVSWKDDPWMRSFGDFSA